MNKNILPKIAQANPYIDYWTSESYYIPDEQACTKVDRFVRMIQEEGIRYTKSFINNLITNER